MSGPYNQQAAYGQGFGQGVGHAGGMNVSQFSGQAANQIGGQAAGQIARQAANLVGGQAAGQIARQAANLVGGQAANLIGRPIAGQIAGQGVGQTGTQSFSTHQESEAHQVQQNSAGRVEKHQHQERNISQAIPAQQSTEAAQSRHASDNQTYHHHRNRDRGTSHSSSNSSAGAYQIKGVEAGAPSGSSQQQYSANSSYAYGAAVGGPYGTGANPCGPTTQVEGPRRAGRHQQQVIRLPDQAQGATRQVRRRLPTPEPDTLERVYVQRVAGEVVEEITEIPTTPPPIVQERNVTEPAGPPQVIKRTIRVPPRGGSGGPCPPAGNVAGQSNNLIGAGSYGSVQQAAGNFQQFGANSPATVPSGYGNAPVGAFSGAAGSFSPVNSSYSSASPAFGSQGANYQQQATGFGGGYQQQAAGFGGGYQQQAAGFGGGYQQQAAGFGGGYPQQAAGFGGGYQQQAVGFGGGYQQQASPFTTGFSFSAQGVTPRPGLHQATCFYV